MARVCEHASPTCDPPRVFVPRRVRESTFLTEVPGASDVVMERRGRKSRQFG